MSRVQLALNVSDLEAAIEFYSKLFGVGPAKVRPGYANFAIVEPALKLVLIEGGSSRGAGISGALNHLGVEVESPEDVMRATSHFSDEGLATEVQEQTTCCYALQDKVWLTDPDGAPWEIYTVLADAPVESGIAGDGRCCATDPAEAPGSTETLAASASSCC